MIPDKEKSEAVFAYFNHIIFHDQLPPIPIYMSNAKGFLGKCVWRKRHTLFGKEERYDYHLRINTRYDMSQQEFEDTIIHEMIHYFISINNIPDTSAHGEVFRKMMAEINAKYGRNISVSHKKTDDKLVDRCAGQRKWHVVAVVDFKDGRRGIKVLPKIMESISYYRTSVMAAPEIKAVKLYWSLHTLFNSFPVSKALKVHFIDRKQLDAALVDAERIENI